MKCILVLCVLLAGWSALPAPSQAQDYDDGPDDSIFQGWGPRLGMTIDPDQVHFGMHLDFGKPHQRLRFQPNAELGLGDGATLLALNFEGAYRFGSSWGSWGPYLGGGIGVNMWGSDGIADEDTELGINALGGLEKGLSTGNRMFVEGKLGLSESPDFKLTAGWTFGH